MLLASTRMQGKFLYVGLSFLLMCGSMGCEKKEEKELKLLCGNSFLKPAEQICKEFAAKTGIKVVTTSGGSEELFPQIKVGKLGDVFITHDPFLDKVKDVGFLAEHTQVGLVVPVLVVPKSKTGTIAQVEDLAKPGLKVGLTDPQYSTCGEMVYALLEKKGIKEKVLLNVGNRLTRGHGQLGTWLKTEAIDAGIMWKGVAYTFKDSIEIVPTPYEYDEEIKVHVMGLNYSKHPEAVKQFVSFAGTRGKEIFAEFGYVK